MYFEELSHSQLFSFVTIEMEDVIFKELFERTLSLPGLFIYVAAEIDIIGRKVPPLVLSSCDCTKIEGVVERILPFPALFSCVAVEIEDVTKIISSLPVV